MKTDLKTGLEVSDKFNWDVCKIVSNGCGTSGWKGKLVPETMWGIRVTDACNVHDYDYHFGETLADKKRADKRFLKNLRTLVKRGSKGWNKIFLPFRLVRCKTYYIAVARGGERAFFEGKK